MELQSEKEQLWMEAEDIESDSHWLVQGAVMALTKLKTEFEEDTSEKIKSEFEIGNVSEDLLVIHFVRCIESSVTTAFREDAKRELSGFLYDAKFRPYALKELDKIVEGVNKGDFDEETKSWCEEKIIEIGHLFSICDTNSKCYILKRLLRVNDRESLEEIFRLTRKERILKILEFTAEALFRLHEEHPRDPLDPDYFYRKLDELDAHSNKVILLFQFISELNYEFENRYNSELEASEGRFATRFYHPAKVVVKYLRSSDFHTHSEYRRRLRQNTLKRIADVLSLDKPRYNEPGIRSMELLGMEIPESYFIEGIDPYSQPNVDRRCKAVQRIPLGNWHLQADHIHLLRFAGSDPEERVRHLAIRRLGSIRRKDPSSKLAEDALLEILSGPITNSERKSIENALDGYR